MTGCSPTALSSVSPALKQPKREKEETQRGAAAATDTIWAACGPGILETHRSTTAAARMPSAAERKEMDFAAKQSSV